MPAILSLEQESTQALRMQRKHNATSQHRAHVESPLSRAAAQSPVHLFTACSIVSGQSNYLLDTTTPTVSFAFEQVLGDAAGAMLLD